MANENIQIGRLKDKSIFMDQRTERLLGSITPIRWVGHNQLNFATFEAEPNVQFTKEDLQLILSEMVKFEGIRG